MKKVKLIWYFLTIIPVLLLILGYIFPSSFFLSQEQIRSFVEPQGILAPIIFIILQILQVVLAPISHYIIGLAGGFIFGTWYGFILNWIGRVLGTLIAFYLGRRFGRRVIRHVVKPNTLRKYDKLFEKGKLILFLMYFLPLFPDDELSYLAGFSSIRARVFIPIILIGHLGGSLGLAFLGSGLSYSNPLFIIFSILTLIAGISFVIYYKKIYQKLR